MHNSGYRPSISIIRVAAMLSILVGHICSWQGINLYQMGGIGVEVFLFVSGYLYANKKIKNRKSWLAARAKRILLPFWILSLFLSGYVLFSGEPLRALVQMGETLLNLQGISRIFPYVTGIGNSHVSGLSHCWFLTVIMICYILVAVLKDSSAEKWVDSHPIAAFLSVTALQILLSYLGIQLSYFIQYFIGYFYGRRENVGSIHKPRFFLYSTAVMIVICAARVVANRYIDGTVFYNHVIARQSFVVLGSWLFWAGDMACERFADFTSRLASSRFWKAAETLSYPLFLVHYMFMKPPFAMNNFVESALVQIGAALVLTWLCAIILQWLERRTLVWLERKMK